MSQFGAQIEKMGRSRNPLVRAGYRGLKALGALRRFLVNPRIRSQVLTRMRDGEQHLQGETASFADRYPEVFAECGRRLGGMADARVLSFGCATGEEVFTLAEYLPEATMVGVDINPWCLKQCLLRNTKERLWFLNSGSVEFGEMTGFDAIFAMAVFQRTEHRTESADPEDTGFTFERFEAEVERLDRKLKAGGLFFLDHSDFSFEQTTVAARYEPLEFEGNRMLRERPLFGRNNQVIAAQHDSPRGFLKKAD